MGWGSGAGVMSEVIAAIRPHLPDDSVRKEIYKALITAFEESDWDTQQDCEGEDIAFDAALEELHPDWYEYEESDEN